MLCEKCGLREATTHFRSNINGQIEEHHYCNECASHNKTNDLVGSFSHTFSDMLTAIFGEPRSIHSQKRCDECGASFSDIINNGKLGCAHCYSVFFQEILPTIGRVHGQTQHIGKISCHASDALKNKRRIVVLKQQLKEAVEAQEYEKAAGIRDSIKELENGGDENV